MDFPVTYSHGKGPEGWREPWANLVWRELLAAVSTVQCCCSVEHQQFFRPTFCLDCLVAELWSCELTFLLAVRILPCPAASCNPRCAVLTGGRPSWSPCSWWFCCKVRNRPCQLALQSERAALLCASPVIPQHCVSVCTANELVPLETCHTCGRTQSASRRETASIVLPNLPASHQFSVQTVWNLKVRKQITSQSDYILLDLWARAAKCQLKIFFLICLSTSF